MPITEVSKEAPAKRPTGLENKLKNLTAKLKRLQTAKFADEASKREAIARTQAGLDQLKNASASSNKGG